MTKQLASINEVFARIEATCREAWLGTGVGQFTIKYKVNGDLIHVTIAGTASYLFVLSRTDLRDRFNRRDGTHGAQSA